jgi:hypothetical protein
LPVTYSATCNLPKTYLHPQGQRQKSYLTADG